MHSTGLSLLLGTQIEILRHGSGVHFPKQAPPLGIEFVLIAKLGPLAKLFV